jgi:hypothetical protein
VNRRCRQSGRFDEKTIQFAFAAATVSSPSVGKTLSVSAAFSKKAFAQWRIFDVRESVSKARTLSRSNQFDPYFPGLRT